MKSFNIPGSYFQKMRRCNPSGRRGLRVAGFSLLEFIVFITIIMILAGIAATRYERSVLRAKEATLKQDLFIMRNAIQQYTLDKEAGPSSLDDLVPKYISAIPVDPMTRNKDWHAETEEVLLDPLQTTPGITDVHSSSNQVSPFENSPYNSW
jgi:general secretion pathway protein G